jgi:hypothetical protein
MMTTKDKTFQLARLILLETLSSPSISNKICKTGLRKCFFLGSEKLRGSLFTGIPEKAKKLYYFRFHKMITNVLKVPLHKKIEKTLFC